MSSISPSRAEQIGRRGKPAVLVSFRGCHRQFSTAKYYPEDKQRANFLCEIGDDLSHPER